MADPKLFRLDLYASLAIQEVAILTPGTHTIAVAPFANSLLSTLWVKSVSSGASVTVRWYDFGPGPGTYPGERVYITSHKTINTDDTSDRIIVPKIHNKAYAEIIITGGNVELGIFVTSVSSFPVDAPFTDGSAFNPTSAAGNANVILDKNDNKFYIQTGVGGSQNVNITGGTIVESPFDVKILTFQGLTTPNILQTLLSSIVTSGKSWRIRQLKIVCRSYAGFELLVDGVIIGEGKTSPAETNVKYDIFPYWPVNENLPIEVRFIQSNGPISEVSAFLQLTEHDL